MASWLNQRNAAAGGILAMVLLVVGYFMTGSPPKFGASANSIWNFYHDHHGTMLVGMILTGIAIPLYIWFVAYLAAAIGGGQGAAIALGGLLVAACAATGDVLNIVIVKAVNLSDNPGAVRVVYQASTLAYTRLFWAGLAVSIPLAFAVLRGALKPWVAWVAAVQAVLYVLGGLSLKTNGFFSPSGGMALIAFLAFFIGTAVIAFGLWQSSPATAEATAAAPTPA
jgi:hypothetical protein